MFEVQKKKTESKTPQLLKTKNGRIMLLLKCAVCNSKKTKLIKDQATNAFKQPGYTFTKNEKIIKKFKETKVQNIFIKTN